MIRYLLRRIGYGFLILIGVNLLTFMLFFTVNTPDDMARLNIGGKRVTLEALKANIVKEDFHVFHGSQLTVCVLTLKNGFTVTGESACADPAMFNAEIGQKIARENAERKIWPLMGYELRSKRSNK